MNIGGVYKIINKINNKYYVGSTSNFKKRWNQHIKLLNRNKHKNDYLQNVWNKYGEKSFEFIVVEYTDVNLVKIIEQKYLDNFGDYNIGLKASGGDNLTKNPNRDKIVENIKKGSKLWRDGLSDKERKEKFSKPLDKNPNWRGGTTYVYCECGKKIGYGHTNCNQCRPRDNKNNPFFGKTHSEKTMDHQLKK